MLTVKVQKSELGGYIAMQEGDSPLRYIAAAGDTEQSAVAALFDYHGDLIRKDRIDTKQVTTGVKPGTLLPDLGSHDPSDHGRVITKAMHAFITPELLGTGQTRTDRQIYSIICHVIRNSLYKGNTDKFLCLDISAVDWIRQALKRHNPVYTPVGEHVRSDANELFDLMAYEDTKDQSEKLQKHTAKAMYYYRHPHKKPPLWLYEREICTFIAALLNSHFCGFQLFDMSLANQYLLLMLDKECHVSTEGIE